GRGEPAFVVSTPRERLRWMDEVGIDIALVNPGSWFLLPEFLEIDRADAFGLANDYLVDCLCGGRQRLLPVALIDFSDLGRAVTELRRMRELGSRAFWVEAQPHGGIAPAHPDWDVFWGAACELGMVAILHVGRTPASFAGWGNAGWMEPGGAGLTGYFSFANAMRHQ